MAEPQMAQHDFEWNIGGKRVVVTGSTSGIGR
jgi:hypothetical protein